MRNFAAILALGVFGLWSSDAAATCDPGGKMKADGTCECPAGSKSVGEPGKARCQPLDQGGKGANNFTVKASCKSGDVDGCKKQCETFKNSGSCIVLGRMYKEGNGVSLVDDEEAVRYFKKACDSGDLLGCVEEGRMHEVGKGTPKNVDKAVKLYGRACDGKQPIGCRELAGNYFSGDGVTKDVPKALDLYQKACDQKDFYACNRLGLIHYDGLGGQPTDDAKAVKLFSKACDGGEGVACSNLASAYDDGRGVPKDHQKALALHEKSCTVGYGAGCNTVGLKHFKGDDFPKDQAKAFTYFEKACTLGEKWGCNNAAFCQEQGQGAPKDEKTAAARYDKACTLGAWDACRSLGEMYFDGRGVAQSDFKSAPLYKKSCDQGDLATGCRDYGFMLWQGRGVTKDRTLSTQYSHKACEGGNMNGCHNEAYAYELGDGAPKDLGKARTIYEKACKNGYTSSCDQLKKLPSSGGGGGAGTITSTGGLVGVFVPSKRDIIPLSPSTTSSFLQSKMPTANASFIQTEVSEMNSKTGDWQTRYTRGTDKRFVFVEQESGARRGMTLDMSSEGFAILPLDVFEKTVVPTGVSEAVVKQYYEAVSRHIGKTGYCKSLIVFANGNAAEVSWNVGKDPKMLTWDTKFFKAGSWTESGYSPILRGPEDADSFTNGGKKEKWIL